LAPVSSWIAQREQYDRKNSIIAVSRIRLQFPQSALTSSIYHLFRKYKFLTTYPRTAKKAAFSRAREDGSVALKSAESRAHDSPALGFFFAMADRSPLARRRSFRGIKEALRELIKAELNGGPIGSLGGGRAIAASWSP
jgi:hypothetical protein